MNYKIVTFYFFVFYHSPSAGLRGKYHAADVWIHLVLVLMHLYCTFVLRGGSMRTKSEVLYMTIIPCKYQLCTIAI